MEQIPEAKSARLLSIYARLLSGQTLGKAELAVEYNVTTRSIQRDIESLRYFLADQGLAQDVVFDRTAKGYRLANIIPKGLSNSEILAVCKILLESRSMRKDEMLPMVASAVCQEIHAQAMKFVQEKKANDEIRAIAAAASRGIQEQQKELYRMMDESHAEWTNEMNEIFQGIAIGLANNDLSQTNKCLRTLAKSYSAQISLYDNGENLIDDLISARNGGKDLHLLRGEM